MAESSGHLLVVDDDENNRDMLSRRLRRAGFDVDVAVDGPAAMDSIGRQPFDLVLLDVEMPGMSGLDVLRRLRKEHAATRLPVIIATARTDRQDVVEALGLGANDYVTKPLDFAIVHARVETQLAQKRAVDRIVALENDLRKRNEELVYHNTRMRRSLDLAARMQRSLLPAAPLRAPGLRFALHYDPCEELGGDILNIFSIGTDHVGVYLLDVSGHGVPAALLSVTLSRVLNPMTGEASLVEELAPDGMKPRAPADVVHRLNQQFQMSGTNDQYFTLFYGVIDLPGRQMRYVSAGHPPSIVLRAGSDPRFFDGQGFAVGWFSDAQFEEHTIDLSEGDRIYIYSDGIIETMSPQSEMYGGSRLAASLHSARHAPLEESLAASLDAVREFRAGAARLDDMSALAIETMSVLNRATS